MEVIVLVGLPAAGKSTFCRKWFDERYAIVSKDLMPKSANRARRQRQLIDEALRAGRSVVVDNTNPSVAARAEIIEQARAYGARVKAIYFPATVAESIARNALREGAARVPNVAIFTTQKKLVPPTTDEGFDEVEVVTFGAAPKR